MAMTALLQMADCGLLLVALGFSRDLWLNEAFLFVIGASLLIGLATMTSLVQLLVPDELRGRVMSIYLAAFRGGMPLGSLLAGAIASRIGPSIALGLNGIVLFAVATIFMTRLHELQES